MIVRRVNIVVFLNICDVGYILLWNDIIWLSDVPNVVLYSWFSKRYLIALATLQLSWRNKYHRQMSYALHICSYNNLKLVGYLVHWLDGGLDVFGQWVCQWESNLWYIARTHAWAEITYFLSSASSEPGNEAAGWVLPKSDELGNVRIPHGHGFSLLSHDL